MGLVDRVVVNGRVVIQVDYDGCNTDEMILLLSEAKDRILLEGRPVRVLSLFHPRNRATPQFMRQFEHDYRQIEHLVERNAVVGLSDIQKWILKGVNTWTRREIVSFDTIPAALRYLTDAPSELRRG